MNRWLRLDLFTLLIVVLLSACAPPPETESTLYYYPAENNQLLSRYVPAFVIEKSNIDSNRIGTVRATSPETVFVDPDSPTLYAEMRHFTTAKGSYTNRIYRVHFQEVPSTFSPYYLGAGKNVGHKNRTCEGELQISRTAPYELVGTRLEYWAGQKARRG